MILYNSVFKIILEGFESEKMIKGNRINFWRRISDVFLSMQKNKVCLEIICPNKAKSNCK